MGLRHDQQFRWDGLRGKLLRVLYGETYAKAPAGHAATRKLYFALHTCPNGLLPSDCQAEDEIRPNTDLLGIIGLGRALRCQNELHFEVVSGLPDAFTFPRNHHGELQLQTCDLSAGEVTTMTPPPKHRSLTY